MLEEGLLIALVEKHPNIYAKKRQDFKDARKKENSWAEIAAAMNVTVEECQRVWRLLRDRYTKERRYLLTEHSGSEAVHVPWTLYNSMKFLEEHVQSRKTTSNVRSRTVSGSSESSQGSILSRHSESSQQSVLSQYSEASEQSMLSQHSRRMKHSESPFDSMSIILDDKTGDSDGDSELDHTIQAEIDESVPGCSKQKNEEIPTSKRKNEEIPTSKSKKPKLDMNNKIENTLDALTATLLNQRNDKNATFAEYVAQALDDLPPQKQTVARRQIIMILSDLEEDNN